MLEQKLGRYLNEIKQRRNQHKFIQLRKETTMPMGKGTYGKTRGRPPAKKKMGGGLTAKQKTLPKSLQAKIMKSKKK